MSLSWKESVDKCQQGVCKFHTFDMDGSYCAHPKSFEASPGFGLSTNAMSREKLCVSAYDDPKENTMVLFEAIKK